MERHTECFLCISIFVILLPNFARPEECTKIFTASPGNLSDLFYAGEQLNVCRYFVRAPGDHYILLNITRLIGFATNSLQNCLPRLVVVSSASKHNRKPSSRTFCSYSEPLPLVVQSDVNELRLIFYGSTSQNSGFSATYTFHTKQEPDSERLCLSCRFPRDTHKTVNDSRAGLTPARHNSYPENGSNQSDENALKHLAIVVLAIVTPVAIFCMCAILIYHCRKKSSCFDSPAMSDHSPRTPSQSDVTTVASNSPLLPTTSTLSAQQNQDTLRQQREVVCRRRPSTEKFPVSISLRDEDEAPHIRNQRLNPDINSDHNLGREGVRGPPNRTVYDSDMYTHEQQRQQKSKTGPVRTLHHPPWSSSHHGGPLPPPPFISRSNFHIVDSITNNPIEIVDSDEAPPPYSSIVPHGAPVNNNLLSVCENRGSPQTGRPAARPEGTLPPPPTTTLSRHITSLDQQSRSVPTTTTTTTTTTSLSHFPDSMIRSVSSREK